ncbi:hypothetical protein V5O39_10025 [Pseudomonas parakoreensis]
MRKSLQLEESYKSLINVLHEQVRLETESACYSAGAVVPETQFLTFMRGSHRLSMLVITGTFLVPMVVVMPAAVGKMMQPLRVSTARTGISQVIRRNISKILMVTPS